MPSAATTPPTSRGGTATASRSSTGRNRHRKMNRPTIRRMCREWAEKFVDIQRNGFKRLGVNADWDHPYLTFQHSYESANVEAFKQMYLDGAVYRGHKPIPLVHALPHRARRRRKSNTATKSPSIYVTFKLNKGPRCLCQSRRRARRRLRPHLDDDPLDPARQHGRVAWAPTSTTSS